MIAAAIPVSAQGGGPARLDCPCQTQLIKMQGAMSNPVKAGLVW